MIKILLLIATHKRPEITRICFQGVERFAEEAFKHGVFIVPHILLDKGDMGNIANVLEFKFGATTSPVDIPLGQKMSDGLQGVAHLEYDYLMQLGSDDLLSNSLIHYYLPELQKKQSLFGMTDLYVYDTQTGNAKFFRQKTGVFGAGRCIRWDIVRAFDGRLWSDYKNSGLDMDSDDRIGSIGRIVRTIPVTRPQVVDIKSDVNIHSYEDIPGEVIRDAVKLYDDFPELIDARTGSMVEGIARDIVEGGKNDTNV